MSEPTEREANASTSDFYSRLPGPEHVRPQSHEADAPTHIVVIDGATLSCDRRSVGLRLDEVFCLGTLMVAGAEGVSLADARALGFLDRGSDSETAEAFLSAVRGVRYVLSTACNIAMNDGVRAEGEGDESTYKLNPNIVFVSKVEADAAEDRARAAKDVGAVASAPAVPAQRGAKKDTSATKAADSNGITPRPAKAAKAAKAAKPAAPKADGEPREKVKPGAGADIVVTEEGVKNALARISALPNPHILKGARLKSPVDTAALLSAEFEGVRLTVDDVHRLAKIVNTEGIVIIPHAGQYSEYARRHMRIALADEIAKRQSEK